MTAWVWLHTGVPGSTSLSGSGQEKKMVALPFITSIDLQDEAQRHAVDDHIFDLRGFHQKNLQKLSPPVGWGLAPKVTGNSPRDFETRLPPGGWIVMDSDAPGCSQAEAFCMFAKLALCMRGAMPMSTVRSQRYILGNRRHIKLKIFQCKGIPASG